MRILTVTVLTALLLACSVQPQPAEVRFQNSVPGLPIGDGLRLGAAQYVGTLQAGDVTPYYSLDAGSYSVQVLQGGSWTTNSLGTFDVVAGHSYTCEASGTWQSFQWLLIRDS